MRRLLCVFLCIVLVYSLSVGAIAASSAATSDLRDAVPESIICDDGTEYLVHVNAGETIYEPVARVSFSVNDTEEIGDFLSNDVIPLEVREDVAKQVKKAAEVGNNDLGITILSSSLYLAEQSNNAIVSSNNTDDETYVNGALMRSEITTYTDVDTGYEYIDKGSATKDTMSNVSSILLSGLGAISRISYVVTGISLLSAFINASGTTPTGHYQDFAQTRVVYDSTKKWTYRVESEDDLALGLISQKVVINELHSLQSYYFPSIQDTDSHETTTYPNSVIKTLSFDDPWEKAYQYSYLMNHATEVITYESGSKSFYLS